MPELQARMPTYINPTNINNKLLTWLIYYFEWLSLFVAKVTKSPRWESCQRPVWSMLPVCKAVDMTQALSNYRLLLVIMDMNMIVLLMEAVYVSLFILVGSRHYFCDWQKLLSCGECESTWYVALSLQLGIMTINT